MSGAKSPRRLNIVRCTELRATLPTPINLSLSPTFLGNLCTPGRMYKSTTFEAKMCADALKLTHYRHVLDL